jgi:hypothetical protein
MDQAEGYNRAKAFYEAHLPRHVERYVSCGWQSLIDGRAEFAFQRERKGKPEFVCVLFSKEDLTGSEEALDRELQDTLRASYNRFLPCRNEYGSSLGGGSKGPRKWARKRSR